MKSKNRRGLAVLLVGVLTLLCVGVGFGTWLLVRPHGPQRPEISVYSHGQLIRVAPYQYCNVLNVYDCDKTQTLGELRVSEHYPVQLSVPDAIYRAPWRLLQLYEDPTNTTSTIFRPSTSFAVTIPPVDPHRGRLVGIVVQLLTLVVDPAGELIDYPHAEWSVRLNY